MIDDVHFIAIAISIKKQMRIKSLVGTEIPADIFHELVALREDDPIELLQNAEPIFSHSLILMSSKYIKGTEREESEPSKELPHA